MKVAGTVGNSVLEILDDKDKTLLQSFLSTFYDNIKDKYELDGKGLRVELEDKEENKKTIPASIFSVDLGISEAVVKFLHENQGMDNREIAKVLKKTPNNVAVTYLKANRKSKKRFSDLDYSVKIPFKAFLKGMTCFEGICLYLKDTYSFHEIGEFLDRDERTIWTVHHKAKAKVMDR